MDLKICALKSVELFPLDLLNDMITSEVIDLITLAQEKIGTDKSENAKTSNIRYIALRIIANILFLKPDIPELSKFKLAGWSVVADRLLNDPSKKVLKIATTILNMLFTELYRDGLYRSTNYSIIQSHHLEKYAQIIFIKLIPHINYLIGRFQYLDQSDQFLSIVPLTSILVNMEKVINEQQQLKVHFTTPPIYLIDEIVSSFLMPFLNSNEKSLVYEAARNIIHIVNECDISNPLYVLSPCKVLIGLLSHDSSRSVFSQIASTIIEGMKLLSNDQVIPVSLLAFQHIQRLDMRLNKHLSFIYNVLQIPLHLCLNNELDFNEFMRSFLDSEWIKNLWSNPEENTFREEFTGCFIKMFLTSYEKELRSGKNNASYTEAMLLLVTEYMKCLTWKTHLRNYNHLLFLQLLDIVCQCISGSKKYRATLRDLLVKVTGLLDKVKSYPICLRAIYIVLKHAPDKGMSKAIISLYKLTKKRFLSFLNDNRTTTSTKEPKRLGFRIDDIRKIPLSTTDIETLLLILQFFLQYPVSQENTQMKLFSKKAIIKYIKQLSVLRKDDNPEIMKRYYHIIKNDIPRLRDVSHNSIKPVSYYPPIEYSSKEASIKSPDDEFWLEYGKTCIPKSYLKEYSENQKNPVTITSPSDPFLITAWDIINIKCKRITLYTKLTNLTNFSIPKVFVYIDTKGRLESYTSKPSTLFELDKIEPGDNVECRSSFRLNYLSINEIHVRVVIIPSVNNPSQTFELKCIPYRVSMKVMVLPWIINYSDFLNDWNRLPYSYVFHSSLDRNIPLKQLDKCISKRYHKNFSYEYIGAFHTCYSGITWWDEKVFISMYGMLSSKSYDEWSIRFEIRTSNSHLLTLLKDHHLIWLNDLTSNNGWFTKVSDMESEDPMLSRLRSSSFNVSLTSSNQMNEENLLFDKLTQIKKMIVK